MKLSGFGLAIGLFLLAVLMAMIFLSFSIPHLSYERKAEFFFSFLIALVGGLVSAGLAYWFAMRKFSIQEEQSNNKAKLDAAISLHDYFNSNEMLACRGQVERLLYENPQGSFQVLYDRLGEERTRCLFVLSRFYQRLKIAIDNDLVDERLVVPFFGELFYWWYIKCFESRLIILDWEMCEHIAGLREWFDCRVDKDKKEKWERRAAEPSPSQRRENLKP